MGKVQKVCTAGPKGFHGAIDPQSAVGRDPVGKQLVMHISAVQPLMISLESSVNLYRAFVCIQEASESGTLPPSAGTRSITKGCTVLHLISPGTLGC